MRTDDGATLHAVEFNPDAGGPAVVLAHGWTLTHAAWGAQARALAADGVRVIAYDQRGHGGSSSGGGGRATIDRLGEDLAGLLDALVPEGPVVLGGHSMGGMTVMALAASRPELFGGRVTGVALVSTSAGDLVRTGPGHPRRDRVVFGVQTRFFAAGERRPAVFARGRALLPGPGRRSHQRVVRRGLFGPGAPASAVEECARMIHGTPPESVCGFFASLAEHDKSGHLSALNGVDVHIVVGDLDRLTPLSHSARLSRELPHAVLHVEHGCGHMALMERPECVTAPLRALLEGTVREGTAAAPSTTPL